MAIMESTAGERSTWRSQSRWCRGAGRRNALQRNPGDIQSSSVRRGWCDRISSPQDEESGGARSIDGAWESRHVPPKKDTC